MARKRNRVSLGDWPRLTRFYGLSPFELARMPRWLTQLYADHLPELEAEEALRLSTVVTIPHLTDRDRDRVLRGMRARAGVEEAVEQIDADTAEGREALAGMGIGLVVDSPGSSDA